MEGTSNQRRLAAILAADVAGYTQLVEQDTDGTVAAWKAARDNVIKPLVDGKSGHIIKFTGDGFLVEFPSVQDAVACAIALQEQLASSSLNFRMGINVGDITDDGGDVHGEGVNIAARLEALAEPGGICISGDVHNQVVHRINAEFTDLGEQEVKHVSRPVRVYAIGLSGRSSSVVSAPALPDKPSIAVLPFDNMSADAEQEFFADGISEDIITRLSSFHSLFVIARNSSFAFKGQSLDMGEISKKLGVQYIVEGSIRCAGNRVRITAQLIDAHTDQHIWAEKYDRDLEDIFVVQDEVTVAIVTAIEPTLASTERQRAHHKPPENLGAWESYQRGLWHLYQYTADDSDQAKQFLRRAIALDPNFSSAYAGLAFNLYYDVVLGFTDDRVSVIPLAYDAATQAVKLDENNPFALVSLGRVHTIRREHEMAIARCDIAISMNPNYASAHFGRAHSLWHLGRPKEAIISHDEAMRLSPRDPLMWAFMASKAIALILLRRYEEALDWTRKGQQQPQNAIWTFMPEVSALGLLGRIDEAQVALDRVRRIKPNVSAAFVDQALPFEHAADREHFVSGLLKAGLPEHDPSTTESNTKRLSIAVLPFDNMSGDPEQEYFSDGITEDIITELARFPSLFVIARNSSFAFKGQATDVTEIGKKLGVQFVVEGSVRKAGERIRVTAQLIDATTGSHLWAERYDRNLDDIFAVQDDVVSQIVAMVPGHVEIANRVQAERKPPQDMNAYDLMLRAMSIVYRDVSSGEIEQLLKQALEIDPEYATAHAMLALIYAYSAFVHGKHSDENDTLAIHHAETALKLDPSNPTSHALSAETYLLVGEHDLAKYHMDKAIVLNPNDFMIMGTAGLIKAYLGDYDGAVIWINKATQNDPYSADAFREVYIEAHFMGGQYELALEQLVGWQSPPRHIYLDKAAALALLGRTEEAREALRQFELVRPEGWNIVDYTRALTRMCARPEDAERWLEGFRIAGLDV